MSTSTIPLSSNKEKPATNPNLEAALAHARRGWFIFPCHETPWTDNKGNAREAKQPYTAHGFRDATLDLKQIRRWWGTWPDALIGIACADSRMFAVDLDRKNGVDGFLAWNEWVEEYGRVTCGPAQNTPSGGAHLLFKYPDDMDVPNNAGKLAPGVDLRSDGYICSGTGYSWQPEHGPDVSIVDAPSWFLAKIKGLSAPKPTQPTTERPAATHATGKWTAADWLAKYLGLAHVGNRNSTGFDLAQQLHDNGFSLSEATATMQAYAARVPGDGYNESEALATCESTYKSPPRDPAQFGPRVREEVEKSPPQALQALIPQASEKYSTFADLANVIGPIGFEWDPWLAKGILTLLASESGMGKSILLMRIVASFLQRLSWPDGTQFTGESGSVLWCEAEAAQALNLERATAWKLPLSKIITPFDDPLADVNLDSEMHQAIITQRGLLPEVKLIAVDSLSGSTGRKENDTEIKKITEFLARLARDTNKPVILTHHLNKGIFGNAEITLDRLRGSTAIVQHARIIWALDKPDPTNPDIKRLQMIKNNLRKFALPVGMSITSAGVKFGKAPTPPKDLSQIEQAQALLRDLLTDGPMKSKVIETTADTKGISWHTMNRAKKNLGIIDRKGEDGSWYWQHPE